MKFLSKILIVLFLIPVVGQAQDGLDTLSLESIFYDPLLAGNRPDFNSFSPDLSRIYYQSNDSAMSEEEHFQVDLKGQNRQQVPDSMIYRYNISPDGNKLTYTEEGNIWLADKNFENKQQLLKTESREYGVTWGPESHRIAFVQEGNAWVIDINSAQLIQVTNKKEEDPSYSIVDWAGEDKVILSQYDTSDYEEYYFPEYVGEYVEAGSSRRGIARRTISIAQIDSIDVEQLYERKGYLSSSVSSNGHYLAIDDMDASMKKRAVKVYDIAQSKWNTVFEDSTQGWLYGTDMDFAPGGNKLMIQSEKDGWNHIYTVNPEGSELEQHTTGDYEIA